MVRTSHVNSCPHEFWEGFHKRNFFFISLLTDGKREGPYHSFHHQVKQRTGGAGLPTQPPSGKQNHIISSARRSSQATERCPWQCLARVVMEPADAWPVPCWGTWLRSKNQETLSTKAMCPLATHPAGVLLGSGLKHQVRIPKGCCLPSGWHTCSSWQCFICDSYPAR